MTDTSTAIPKPKYRAGQRVEVEMFDFDTAGFPRAWMPGTVEEVCWDEDIRLFAVRIVLDTGRRVNQLVGRRGGNKVLRPMLAAA